MNNTAFAKPFFSFSQIYGLHPIFAFILISRKKKVVNRGIGTLSKHTCIYALYSHIEAISI